MAKIVVHLDHTIEDGEKVTFKAPCNSEDHSTLKIYYPINEGGTETSAEFTIKDAMGESQSAKGGLFKTNAYVTVAIDTANLVAYIHNPAFRLSNQNLLDNWFFPIPVNQREITTVNGAGSSSGAPTIDRWKLFGSSANYVTVISGGLTVKSGSNGFLQAITSELADALDGKVVTLSVMDTDGNIVSGTLTFSKTTLQNIGTKTIGSKTINLYCGPSGGRQLGISILTGSDAIDLMAAKLELGPVSTLANDAPPNFAEELAKCQYYYREIKCTVGGYAGIGYVTAATQFRVPFHYHMRVRPTVTFSGSLTGYFEGGNAAVTSIDINGFFSDVMQLVFTVSGGLTAGKAVALYMEDGSKIALSSEF